MHLHSLRVFPKNHRFLNRCFSRRAFRGNIYAAPFAASLFAFPPTRSAVPQNSSPCRRFQKFHTPAVRVCVLAFPQHRIKNETAAPQTNATHSPSTAIVISAAGSFFRGRDRAPSLAARGLDHAAEKTRRATDADAAGARRGFVAVPYTTNAKPTTKQIQPQVEAGQNANENKNKTDKYNPTNHSKYLGGNPSQKSQNRKTTAAARAKREPPQAAALKPAGMPACCKPRTAGVPRERAVR